MNRSHVTLKCAARVMTQFHPQRLRTSVRCQKPRTCLSSKGEWDHHVHPRPRVNFLWWKGKGTSTVSAHAAPGTRFMSTSRPRCFTPDYRSRRREDGQRGEGAEPTSVMSADAALTALMSDGAELSKLQPSACVNTLLIQERLQNPNGQSPSQNYRRASERPRGRTLISKVWDKSFRWFPAFQATDLAYFSSLINQRSKNSGDVCLCSLNKWGWSKWRETEALTTYLWSVGIYFIHVIFEMLVKVKRFREKPRLAPFSHSIKKYRSFRF